MYQWPLFKNLFENVICGANALKFGREVQHVILQVTSDFGPVAGNLHDCEFNDVICKQSVDSSSNTY